MGKTKTAFVTDSTADSLSGEEKYKAKQLKKEQSKLKTEDTESVVKTSTKEKKIHVRGKKYLLAKTNFDQLKKYPLKEAIDIVKKTSYSKFDGTVEMHIIVKKENLNVNVNLPFSTGKTKKVEIADEKTLEKLKTGKIDFDVLLALPDMMPKLVAFARLLGPKGLMPNPRNGTVIKNEKEAAKFSGNSIKVKTEKTAPVIHTIIGKVSQKESELEENAKAIFEALGPKQAVKAYLKPTMGPSVKISL